MFNTKLRLAVAACSIAAATANIAQADDVADYVKSGVLISPVVVTATRAEQNSFDLPVSIDVVGKESIQDGQLGMTLSESLIRVPGLTAQNRSQLAQDPQISTRGFGSRSAFGVRGVRVFVDGIPLTMPDGIAQPGNVDLQTVKSIEVMRGPFSSLYGSSSGGVIQLITDDAPKTPEVDFRAYGGSYGTTEESTKAAGIASGVEYLLNISHYNTDGYRQHSAAWKDQATAQLRFDLTDATKIKILASWLNMKAQDPLGLARTNGFDKRTPSGAITTNAYYSAFTNPTAVPDVAISADTRVSRTNTQAGINLEHQLNNDNIIKFVGSVGHRDNMQFLALPVLDSASTNLTRGRGSSISRDFWNTELTWANKGDVFKRDYSITSGITYGSMTDDRLDINALFGSLLSPGTNNININRNDIDKAHNFDQFIQAKLAILDAMDIHAGLRHSDVSLDFQGQTPVNSTTNINGATSFNKTTPVIGAVWKVNQTFNLYANYGKGFETPTLIEMAYNSATVATGPNLNLHASTSDNYEVGMKTFLFNNTQINLALFKIDTNQEIIVSANSTYTVYSNAGKTKRKGLELSFDSQLPYNIGLYGAYTYLDARFDSQYTSGITAGTNGIVNPGYFIPGTYSNQLYGEISWKYPALSFKTAIEGRMNSKVYINDVNSDAAPGYAVFNLRGGFEQSLSNWKFTEYARIENLLDRSYIGSVRINDNNNRNFEPAAPRNWLLGLNASYRF